jgi:hypothetical protein
MLSVLFGLGCSSAPATTASAGWVNRTQGRHAGQQLWTAVASNASGDSLVAVNTFVIPPAAFAGDIWTSKNAGRTWAPAGPRANLEWSSVASDSTGTQLVAAFGGLEGKGNIWTSTDGGASWTDRTSYGPASYQSWTSVASDSTGTHLVAVAAYGDIWTSSDSGSTWNNRTPFGSAHGQNWVSVASDSTGDRLVAVAGGGHAMAGPDSTGDIWTSQDYGATWIDQTSSGPAHDHYWTSAASDSSGTHFVAVGSGIWTSANAGTTWTQQTAPTGSANWVSVASDSTGTRLVAAVGWIDAGDIWASTDSGVTWSDLTAGTAAASQPWSAVGSDASGAHIVGVVRGGDLWTL